MKLEFSVEETVKARRSVRTFEKRKLSLEDKGKIRAYIEGISNPFLVDVTLRLLEGELLESGEKLGTYGVIKGAEDFIGASVKPGELALEALGYSFEKLILYVTSLGLGSCWLGGTFDKSGFAGVMGLEKGVLFPAVSPVGYALDKKRVWDSMTRWAAKSDQRFEWNKLFFKGDFSEPLSKEEAGEYAFALDMLRLAPSAVNKQPWRIVKDKGAFHFYKDGATVDSSKKLDIKRTDVGIAACHFHLAALERDLQGKFAKLEAPDIRTAEPVEYLFSWLVG